MTKVDRLVKTEVRNVSIYKDYQLQEISNWLLKYQAPEIYYIEKIFKQYKTASIDIKQILADVKADDTIKNDQITSNIITVIITELAAYLKEYTEGNILNKIEQILYEVYVKEALRIINFPDNNFEDLEVLFDKASSLGMPTESLSTDIDNYLWDIIKQELTEDTFYKFIRQLDEILLSKNNRDNIKEELKKEANFPFDDIEKNIISIIGE